MMKKILTSKIINAITAQTTIMGLKMSEAHTSKFHVFGLMLFATSAVLLVNTWLNDVRHETKPAKAKRSPRRSRATKAVK